MRWMDRRGLSRRRMRGGAMHRWFGEHLFNRHLWRLERDGLARAVFWGSLSAFSPFFGFHLVIGLTLAMVFRANIPATAAIQFITNPATILAYYPFAYWLGAHLLREPMVHPAELRGIFASGSIVRIWESLGTIGWPLFLGCTVCGLAFGGAGWLLVRIFWPSPRRVSPETSRD